MALSLKARILAKLTDWLLQEIQPQRAYPLSDFDRISYEIRPCDILLIEGRSRVSEVIGIITQSPWTHAALYIGRLHDIENPHLRQQVEKYITCDPGSHLIIESIMGKGTVVSPLSIYRQEHIRICRPKGLSRKDAQQVISYAIGKLGVLYDIRQIFDLARFLLPWHIFPRRWRSSLFTYNPGTSTKQSCSSLLAEAFSSVHFPVLPVFKENGEAGLQLLQRNPRLFTPSDFDYSPFFEIIKYPIFELSERGVYRDLPWNKTGYTDDDGQLLIAEKTKQAANTNNIVETNIAEKAGDTKKSSSTEQSKTVKSGFKKFPSKIWDFFD